MRQFGTIYVCSCGYTSSIPRCERCGIGTELQKRLFRWLRFIPWARTMHLCAECFELKRELNIRGRDWTIENKNRICRDLQSRCLRLFWIWLPQIVFQKELFRAIESWDSYISSITRPTNR